MFPCLRGLNTGPGESMRSNLTVPETRQTLTRRKAMTRIALAFGVLAPGSRIWSQTPQQAIKETPSTGENKTRTSLRQQATLKANAKRVYQALLDSKQF